MIAAVLAAALATPPAETPIDLTTPTGIIHGTLVLPSGDGKVPVVLIIAGSGPTERDGNNPLLPGKNNAYKMLADALAADGIASLRYDKRGIGASRAAGGKESDLRFDNYVDDAAAWVGKLAENPRLSKVIIAGHSEGSLIGMLAASRTKAAAFVSVAGVAKRASDVMKNAPAERMANVATYGNPELPIVADVPNAIVQMERR